MTISVLLLSSTIFAETMVAFTYSFNAFVSSFFTIIIFSVIKIGLAVLIYS